MRRATGAWSAPRRSCGGGLAAAVDYYQNQPTPSLLIVESLDRRAAAAGLPRAPGRGVRSGHQGHRHRRGQRHQPLSRADAPRRERISGPAAHHAAADRGDHRPLRRPGRSPFVGRQIAFCGAKGGVGRLDSGAQRRPADLRAAWAPTRCWSTSTSPSAPPASTSTRIPLHGIADALSQPDRLDPVLMERMMARCGDHLVLFAAPANLERDFDISPRPMKRWPRRSAPPTPYVVLDLPHAWSRWKRRMLITSDDVVIVAEPDLASPAQRQEHRRPGPRRPAQRLAAAGGAEQGRHARPPGDPAQGFRRGAGPGRPHDHRLRRQAVRPGRQQRPDDRRGRAEVESRPRASTSWRG